MPFSTCYSLISSITILASLVSFCEADAAKEQADRTSERIKEDIGIGNVAPAIAVSNWMQGEPVTEFEKGQVYIMEFWASWCAPCIAGMPHLSEIQRVYQDDVTVIGMNIWEDPVKAAAWVEEQGKQLMDYTIAIQAGTQMESLWMRAASQDGIPTAFIVDQAGVIVWIGHPMSIDEPLKQVVNGEWDFETFKKNFVSDAEVKRRQRAVIAQFEESAKSEIEEYLNATEALDLDGISKTATAIIKLRPPTAIAENLFGVGIHRMLTGDRAALAVEFIWENKRVIADDKAALTNYARSIIYDDLFQDARDADLAVALLENASERSEHEDSYVLDLLSRAYLLKAIQVQEKALHHASEDAVDIREKHLDQYLQAMPGEQVK